MHDPRLVKALRVQRTAALAAVYDLYAKSVYGYCFLLLGNRATAEETLRDTFLVAELRIDDLSSADRLKCWLFAIARAEALRRRPASRPPSRPPAPHVAPRGVGARSMAGAAVAALDADEREVLELSVRHGFSDADVAAVLQVPKRTARVRVAQARRRLRRTLTAVILSRTGREGCRRLAGMTRPEHRFDRARCRRIAWHARICRRCGRRGAHQASLGKALALLAPADIAPGLRVQVLSSYSDPSLISYRLHLARRAGALGWLRDGVAGRRGRTGGASAGATATTAILLLVGAAVATGIAVPELWRGAEGGPVFPREVPGDPARPVGPHFPRPAEPRVAGTPAPHPALHPATGPAGRPAGDPVAHPAEVREAVSATVPTRVAGPPFPWLRYHPAQWADGDGHRTGEPSPSPSPTPSPSPSSSPAPSPSPSPSDSGEPSPSPSHGGESSASRSRSSDPGQSAGRPSGHTANGSPQRE